MQVEFVRERNPDREQRVRTRYAEEIQELERLGFRIICCYTELLGRFSALWALPIVFLMKRRREVLSIRGPLQVGGSFMLLGHDDPATVALPMGYGVRFYSAMENGPVVISTRLESAAPAQFDSNVLKYAEAVTRRASDTWREHTARIAGLVANGHRPTAPVDYALFVTMATREQNAIFGLA